MRRVLVWIGFVLASGLLPLEALALTCSQHSRYEVEGRLVYYYGDRRRLLLSGIDAATFRPLVPQTDPCMAGYARDARSVLYEGVRISVADANSFQVVAAGWNTYAKDRNRAYAGDRVISEAVDQFRVVNSGYATDGKTVFYGATRLPGRNLVGLGFDYAKTEVAVFHQGKVLVGLDPASFQVFKDRPSYGRDRSKVVFQGNPIAEADAASFEIIAPYVDHARDRKHVYYNGKVVVGADPATIRQIGMTYYFRDARAVYVEGQEIAGADPATFRLGKYQRYAVDKARVYKLRDVVADRDAATFEELAYPYSKDKNGVYFHDKPMAAEATSFHTWADNRGRDKYYDYSGDRPICSRTAANISGLTRCQ